MNKVRPEPSFQDHFLSELVDNQGYLQRYDKNYSKARAMDTELLFKYSARENGCSSEDL